MRAVGACVSLHEQRNHDNGDYDDDYDNDDNDNLNDEVFERTNRRKRQ